ncbi:MAG TPA: C-terminal binding protein [Gaiella sp.]|jgi:D-3-phosphoglycerate dehydrogenase
MTRVLVTDIAWPSLDIEREILGELGAELVLAETGEEGELLELAATGIDAILTNWRRVPPAALDAAPGCLVVARYGVGVDNIPVKHATKLGIVVVNVPDFCIEEVSDHALALLLACARRIVTFTRGGWNLEAARGMRRLRGQTLGLVGFGSIAQQLVPKAQGLGLRLLAHSRSIPDEPLPGVEGTRDLVRLLRESDFVSLHAPATPETVGLIGEAELRAMKRTAYLVNTSRGALVDETALARALREGWIAGAALDVLAEEPPPPSHPLFGLDTCFLTPHAAFYSDDAVAELETKAATNVATVLRGGVPATVVNPEVLAAPNLRLRVVGR